MTFLGFIQFFPATANTHRLLKFCAVSSPSLSIKDQAFPKQQTILGYGFQRVHGQHFTKINNKSLGSANEFKTKATSRYMKKTTASSPKRHFLNSLPCRKPLAKLYIPGEPGVLCPGQAPACQTRSSSEQGECWPQARPYPGVISSLGKVFLPEIFYNLPHTLQSNSDESSCGSYCQKSPLPLLVHQPEAQPCRWMQQRKSY